MSTQDGHGARFFPNWSPTMNVRLVLSNVREVLKNPVVVETPLEAELAELYANDRPKFDKLVKDHEESREEEEVRVF